MDTNAFILSTLLLTNLVSTTNWSAVPRWSEFDNGTNYNKFWISEIRTDKVEQRITSQIVWHTNYATIGTERALFTMTNSPSGIVKKPLPPLPGKQ